jgi:hypothetical protein
MTALACILLLAASTRVDLVSELYQIPANEWRYVEVSLKQQPALVSARYRAQEGSREIRLALLRKADLERLRSERPFGVLASTQAGAAGRLQFHVPEPGQYALVVDNAGDRPAAVHLDVWLDFAGPHDPTVTQLSPSRQLTIVLLSFAAFFGIVTWSARRLLRATKRTDAETQRRGEI